MGAWPATKPRPKQTGYLRGTLNTFDVQKKLSPRKPLKSTTSTKENDKPEGEKGQATGIESKEAHQAWSLSVSKIANHGNSDPFGGRSQILLYTYGLSQFQ